MPLRINVTCIEIPKSGGATIGKIFKEQISFRPELPSFRQNGQELKMADSFQKVSAKKTN